MAKYTAETLREHLYNLILDVRLSATERSLLIASKNALERGEYFPKVVKELKTVLSPLAVQQQLSIPVTSLLVNLTRQYPGDNMWDNLTR